MSAVADITSCMTAGEIEVLLREGLRVQAKTPYSVRELTIALRPFLAWAVDVAALDPNLSTLMTRTNVELFTVASKGQISDASRGNFRSRLLRLCEALTGARGAIRLSALPAAEAPRPYSKDEIASLVSWASSRSTPDARRNADVLLGLGLGAGLTASEIGNLRSHDVYLDAQGVQVRVCGARARVVEMVGVWAERMRPHVENGSEYVFRPGRTKSWPNIITSFAGRSDREVRPQTQRMRATWIVRHLEARTHVVTLMDAAGVASLEAFTRFMGFVEHPGEQEARRSLALRDC